MSSLLEFERADRTNVLLITNKKLVSESMTLDDLVLEWLLCTILHYTCVLQS